MRLAASGDLLRVLGEAQSQGKRCGLLLRGRLAPPPVHSLRRLPDAPEGYARGLYAALRGAVLDGRLPPGTKLPASRASQQSRSVRSSGA